MPFLVSKMTELYNFVSSKQNLNQTCRFSVNQELFFNLCDVSALNFEILLKKIPDEKLYTFGGY